MKDAIMLGSCLLLLGCAEKNIKYSLDSFMDASPAYIDAGVSAVDYSVGTWICYKPGTSLHGTECTPDCFEEGNESIFCWQIGGQRDAN